jgi:hypothetical protein
MPAAYSGEHTHLLWSKVVLRVYDHERSILARIETSVVVAENLQEVAFLLYPCKQRAEIGVRVVPVPVEKVPVTEKVPGKVAGGVVRKSNENKINLHQAVLLWERVAERGILRIGSSKSNQIKSFHAVPTHTCRFALHNSMSIS